jgi:hypothetical protein
MRINNNLPTQYCRESIMRICSLLIALCSKITAFDFDDDKKCNPKSKGQKTEDKCTRQKRAWGICVEKKFAREHFLTCLKFKRLPRKTTLPSSHIKSPKHEPIKKRHNTISHSFKHVAVFHWTHLQYCKIL